jgi:hypothetical protein
MLCLRIEACPHSLPHTHMAQDSSGGWFSRIVPPCLMQLSLQEPRIL